jgi:hypothetical protein
LTLDASTSFHGLVGGFGAGDQIDLQDIAFVASTKKSGTKASFTEAANFDSGTLTITDGTHTANIRLFGEYIASEFVAEATVMAAPSSPSPRQRLRPGVTATQSHRR